MSEFPTGASRRVDWSRAFIGGLIATVAITISMALFGVNIMKNLGSMILPDANLAVQYAVGGAIHLMIGLLYGFLYAFLFGPLIEWNRGLKGVVFGLAIGAIALAVMPVLASVMGRGAANPCASRAANPCNPCASTATNPCNPCASKATNPCQPKGDAANACSATKNPCNPCGGGGGVFSDMISILNHLIYGMALALIYRRP